MSKSTTGTTHSSCVCLHSSRPLIGGVGIHAMSTCTAIGWLLLGMHAVAHAETTFKWTDDQGKVHYADVVPKRYRGVAKPVVPAPVNPSAEERQAALAQAALARSAAAGAQASAPMASSVPPGARSSDPPATRRPAQVPHADTDCDTWMRLYKESLECFGPYRTARGATRAEAFNHCTPIDAPPSRCRMHVSE